MMLDEQLDGGASVFSPLVLTGGKIWLDGLDPSTMWTTDGRTVQTTDTAKIGSIKNKLGSDYFDHTNSARWPTYNAGRGITLDGVNNWLASPKANHAWVADNNANLSLFVILKPVIGASDRVAFAFGGYNYPGLSLQKTSADYYKTWAGNGSSAYSSVATAQLATAAVTCTEVFFDNIADTVNISKNNAAYAQMSITVNLGYHTSDSSVSAGAAVGTLTQFVQPYSGDIAEVVAVQNISSADRTSLLQYFQTRHGLSLGV